MPRDEQIKPSWYYILLALSAGERHGLDIAREVARLSGDRLRLWPTTLYGSIEALSDRGWIVELQEGDRRSADASERKRVYALTPPGRAAVKAETLRLENLVRVARSLEKAGKRGRA